MEQEKELLHNQNTWLNTELKTKTDELLALGREKGNEILELKCNLENKKELISLGIPTKTRQQLYEALHALCYLMKLWL